MTYPPGNHDVPDGQLGYGDMVPEMYAASPPEPGSLRGPAEVVRMALDGLLGGLFGGLMQALQGMFSGGGFLGGILSQISTDMGSNWNRLEMVEDGQLALNDRVDLISPLEDFGACYAPGGDDLMNTGVVPFNRQIGPMKNCRISGSEIVLEDKGLWDIRARLAFSWTVLSGEIDWRIEVLRPDGSVYTDVRDQTTHSASTTREISNAWVVVPEPGYRVRVRITTLVVGRHTKGGPVNNRLTVHHLTRSTDNPI